ncbi:MAG: endonuclease/exonuclease/phosphatase family protein [Bacteroidota bacterium]
MNYNVRLFNRYKWIENEKIPLKISNLIKNNDPDVLCIQEFFPSEEIQINYPYKYIELKGKKHDFGQAIYSKYKIIKKGSLDFRNTSNNAIYIDILKNNDTIRIYNLHLQSLGLKTNKQYLGQANSEKILKRLSNSFIKQQEQVEEFLVHKNQCEHKIIISGDFNNTSYSWAYHEIKGEMNDTFNLGGAGFGKTFEIKKYPLRIDFILTDKNIEVRQHQNFTQKYSDHFPVLARLKI